jgi:hypothetical protein
VNIMNHIYSSGFHLMTYINSSILGLTGCLVVPNQAWTAEG